MLYNVLVQSMVLASSSLSLNPRPALCCLCDPGYLISSLRTLGPHLQNGDNSEVVPTSYVDG